MLDQKHDAVFPPKSNCTIWRYSDLTKLLSLLENQKLIFVRADQFDDPYEGALSHEAVRQLRDPKINGGLPLVAIDQFLRHAQQVPREMFLSCWHMSDHESAAMWKLYLQSSEGVAIRSDYEALAATLERSPLRARISMVKYIDYDKVPISMGNLFFPFVHKRLSFAHESEIRAVIWSFEGVNKPQIAADAVIVAVDVKPEELIKSVHVSPVAPKWFGELVVQLIRRYGLNVPIVRSSLYDRPSY